MKVAGLCLRENHLLSLCRCVADSVGIQADSARYVWDLSESVDRLLPGLNLERDPVVPRPLTNHKFFSSEVWRPLVGAESLLVQGWSPRVRVKSEDGSLKLSDTDLRYLGGDTICVPALALLMLQALRSVSFDMPSDSEGQLAGNASCLVHHVVGTTVDTAAREFSFDTGKKK